MHSHRNCCPIDLLTYIWNKNLAPLGVLNFQTKKRHVLCEPNKNNVKVTINRPKTFKNEKLKKLLSSKLETRQFNLIDAGNMHLCIKKKSFTAPLRAAHNLGNCHEVLTNL